jgi:hypothetical protein
MTTTEVEIQALDLDLPLVEDDESAVATGGQRAYEM